MIPVLFYGVEYGSSFGSIVALEKLGQPYQLCRIEMPDESQSDAYKTINPVGEVPALVTETGNVLTESVAILHHIAERGIDKALGHTGEADRDRFLQVLAFLNSRYFSAFNPLWFSVEFGAGDQKAALRAEGEALVSMATRKLEAVLGSRDWLMGDRMTVADAYYAGVARWNDIHKVVEWNDYPRAKALFDRVEADATVRFAHAIEDEGHAEGGSFRGHVSLVEAARLIGLAGVDGRSATTPEA
jgi:glutathione S-transferase